MGQVLWHVTMSLDGFIAGPRDDMTWLGDYLGPNPAADDVLAQVGALLMGERTYQLAKTEEGKPYGGAWTGPQFVLSHHPPKNSPAGFTFLSGDIKRPWPGPRRLLGTTTSSSLVPTPPGRASTQESSTRSWCTSHPSCLAMVFGSTTIRAAPTSSSNRSALLNRPR